MRHTVSAKALRVGIAIWVAITGAAAYASSPSSLATQLPPAVQAKLDGQDMQVDATFNAGTGLTGFIVSHHRAKPMAIYLTQDARVLVGALLDSNGNDLGPAYVKRYAKEMDLSAFERRLEAAPAVVEGAGVNGTYHTVKVKSIIYVFIDPNCIYCHLTWKALQHYEAAGVQVHWILVGLLRQDSVGRAAMVLDARDPVGALQTLEAQYIEATESGGLPAEIRIPPATMVKLDGNADLMKDMGYIGTPTVLYRDHSGALKAHEGIPSLAELPDILGVPQIRIDDPELRRIP